MSPMAVKKSELYKNFMNAGAGKSMLYHLFHMAAIFGVFVEEDFDKLTALHNILVKYSSAL